MLFKFKERNFSADEGRAASIAAEAGPKAVRVLPQGPIKYISGFIMDTILDSRMKLEEWQQSRLMLPR